MSRMDLILYSCLFFCLFIVFRWFLLLLLLLFLCSMHFSFGSIHTNTWPLFGTNLVNRLCLCIVPMSWIPLFIPCVRIVCDFFLISKRLLLEKWMSRIKKEGESAMMCCDTNRFHSFIEFSNKFHSAYQNGWLLFSFVHYLLHFWIFK